MTEEKKKRQEKALTDGDKNKSKGRLDLFIDFLSIKDRSLAPQPHRDRYNNQQERWLEL